MKEIKEFIARFNENKKSYMIAYLLLVLAAIIGFVHMSIFQGAPQIGFYLGFLMSTLVLFALYSCIDFFLNKGKEDESL
ncbi:hypothetical protein [Alkalihalobacillus sp. LMS39]|uniref:hypothetical protein n=1 Tax=Alkalihalobacillus sp. LMS39 TaxID=2924032 RepID=UPI001FB27717|nr:hypothetical protein [Alkalihalobacillus sp. LMS39]UOE94600.1 hypothetical protein MM271_02730 [Alkalihalobacillus sp. LMS39]